MTNDEIQAVIDSKTAPKVTEEDVAAAIASEHYFTAADGAIGAKQFQLSEPPQALHLLTFCVLVLRNGFTVTGESAVASPENFDAAVGRGLARKKAVEKIWPLLGFELRSKLAAGA